MITASWFRSIGAGILCAALVCAPLTAGAQDPALAQEAVRRELLQRGLTEAEARARLAREGIMVDQITADQLPALRGRIVQILDQLAREKSSTDSAARASRRDSLSKGPDLRTVSVRPVFPPDSTRIYGHAIFRDQSLDLYSTTDGSRAPDTYVIGVGDRLRINLFGSSQADLVLDVSPDGFVQPNGIPKIFVQGLTLGAARQLLRGRLSAFYTFTSDQFFLNLLATRTVRVSVLGEAMVRGGYSVSALNTPLNVLVAAGGVSELGSVRSIQLLRGTQRFAIDVYAFLRDPATAGGVELRDGDILFVPVSGKIVEISGAVRRPMRYEVTGSEGLKELIEFAGGLRFDSNSDYVQVQRVEGDQVVLREWRLEDVTKGRVLVPLVDGDVVRVREIGRSLERYVAAQGAVTYPGIYDLDSNPTLGSLISAVQPRPFAADFAYVIRRDSLNSTRVQHLRVSISEGEGFRLQRGDSLVVLDRSQLEELGTLSVEGAVRRMVVTPYDENLGVRDLVTLAGGATLAAALDRVDVFRLVRTGASGTTFERIAIQLDSSYHPVSAPTGFRLQPFDVIVVREKPLFSLERTVSLVGQVQYPGTYVLSSERTYLTDVIEQAGGLSTLADADYAVVLRQSGDVGPVGVDLRAALASRRDPLVDPLLLAGDEVTISRRQNTVAIRLYGTKVGQLQLRGLVDTSRVQETSRATFVFAGKRSARWYLEQYAGGLAQNADPLSITVTDPSGRVRGTRRVFLFFKDYPEVLPGSTVSLQLKESALRPAAERKVDWDAVLTRSTQTLTALLTLVILGKQL